MSVNEAECIGLFMEILTLKSVQMAEHCTAGMDLSLCASSALLSSVVAEDYLLSTCTIYTFNSDLYFDI